MVFSNWVDEVVINTYIDLEKRYEIKFLEIGIDNDFVNFIDSVSPNILCCQDSKKDKEFDSEGGFSKVSRSKKGVIERKVLG